MGGGASAGVKDGAERCGCGAVMGVGGSGFYELCVFYVSSGFLSFMSCVIANVFYELCVFYVSYTSPMSSCSSTCHHHHQQQRQSSSSSEWWASPPPPPPAHMCTTPTSGF